jgi:flagellar basal-body rod modification protein FlgD
MANTANNTSGTPTASSTLDMATFLKLLTVQLSSQDPLNPMSDTDFFSQLAQMGTVQGVDQMKQTLQVSQAASLMGKTVSAMAASNGVAQQVTGVVNSLSIQNGTYLLNLTTPDGGAVQVSMDNIEGVSN